MEKGGVVSIFVKIPSQSSIYCLHMVFATNLLARTFVLFLVLSETTEIFFTKCVRSYHMLSDTAISCSVLQLLYHAYYYFCKTKTFSLSLSLCNLYEKHMIS